MTNSHYTTLGVNRTCSARDITTAYHALALRFHPDKVHGSETEKKRAEARFREIKDAYDVLSNENRRRSHDVLLDEKLRFASDEKKRRAYDEKQRASTRTTPTGSHYATLGVNRTCSARDINKAYHRAVARHFDQDIAHDNKTEQKREAEEFRKIKAAYEVLFDAHRRRAYDNELAAKERQGASNMRGDFFSYGASSTRETRDNIFNTFFSSRTNSAHWPGDDPKRRTPNYTQWGFFGGPPGRGPMPQSMPKRKREPSAEEEEEEEEATKKRSPSNPVTEKEFMATFWRLCNPIELPQRKRDWMKRVGNYIWSAYHETYPELLEAWLTTPYHDRAPKAVNEKMRDAWDSNGLASRFNESASDATVASCWSSGVRTSSNAYGRVRRFALKTRRAYEMAVGTYPVDVVELFGPDAYGYYACGKLRGTGAFHVFDATELIELDPDTDIVFETTKHACQSVDNAIIMKFEANSSFYVLYKQYGVTKRGESPGKWCAVAPDTSDGTECRVVDVEGDYFMDADYWRTKK